MKAVAAIVIVVGLTLMSAPIVLPRLGIDPSKALGSAAAAKAPSAPGSAQESAQGSGGVGAVGAAVSQWVGSVGSFLGAGGTGKAPAAPAGVPSPAEVQAQFAAVCGALSGADGSVDCSGSTADFATTFGRAAAAISSGEMPAEAFATGPGAASAPGLDTPGRAPGVSIIGTSTDPARRGGAKFLKAPGVDAKDDAP